MDDLSPHGCTFAQLLPFVGLKKKCKVGGFTVSFTLFPWVRFVLSAALLNYICSDEVGSAEVVQERSGRLGVWPQHSGSGVYDCNPLVVVWYHFFGFS